MPDVQEVFRSTTQNVRPDPGFVDRQHNRRRTQERRRKIGAFAVAAAIAVAVAVLVVRSAPDARQSRPAASESSVTVPGAPQVDYVIDLNTRMMTPLPEAIIRSLGEAAEGRHAESRYAVSPDGSVLAYVGTGDGTTPQIFVAGIDGAGVRQMTHDPRRAAAPAWSPDSTLLAYVGYGSGDALNLFVLDVATGESTPIAEVGRVPSWAQPQFTPDGSSLLYTDGGSTHAVLRTVPIAGGKSTVLIGRDEGMGYAANGSLSPDGSLVTMMGNEIGGPGAGRFVANADGTELRSISGADSVSAGTWSPDGSRIVCSNFGGRYITVVDIATGSGSPVAEGRGAIWLDDHTLLVEV